jgi:hypothetical protein
MHLRQNMDRQRSNRRLFLVLPVLLAAIALLIGSVWGGRWLVGSPKVSLTFLGYKGWTWESIRYAELRLSNNTTNSVRYARKRDDPLSWSVMLFYREQTANGWSDEQPEPGSRGAVFSFFVLKPGQSMTFLAPVKPGALPKQVAIAREVPLPSAFRRNLIFRWLRIRAALRIQPPRNDVLFRAAYKIPSPLNGLLWCEKVLVLPKLKDEEESK